MSNATFSLLSGEGGSGIINIFPLSHAGVLGTEVTPTAYTKGVPNIKVSSLTGTIESQTLALSGEIQITEESVVTGLRALINNEAVEIVDNIFEDGQNLKVTKNYASKTLCLIVHYLPKNQSATGNVLVTVFTAMLDLTSGEITTDEGTNNVIKFNAIGTYAPAAVTLIGTSINSDIIDTPATPADDIVVADGTYGTYSWMDGV